MRYLAMQVLTWGTVAGAAGSALLLAAQGGSTSGGLDTLRLVDATRVVSLEPAQPRPSGQTSDADVSVRSQSAQ